MRKQILDRFHPEYRMFLFAEAPMGGGPSGQGDGDAAGSNAGDSSGDPSGGAPGPGDGGNRNEDTGGSNDDKPTEAETKYQTVYVKPKYDWGKYMRGQWKDHLNYIIPMYDEMREIANTQWDWSKEDRARWESEFKPLEDALIADAETYASQGKKELEAGRASADVTKAFAAQKDSARRSLEGYGIDPSQTRSQAIDAGIGAQAAATAAAAGNNARDKVTQQGWKLRDQAITLGDATKQRALVESQSAVQSNNAAGGLMNNAYSIGMGYVLGGAGLDYDYAALQQNADQFKQGLDWDKYRYEDGKGKGGGVDYLGIGALGLDIYDQAGGFDPKPKTTNDVTVSSNTQYQYDPNVTYDGSNLTGGQGPANNNYNPGTTPYAEGGLVPALAMGGMSGGGASALPGIMQGAMQKAGAMPPDQGRQFMQGVRDGTARLQGQQAPSRGRGEGNVGWGQNTPQPWPSYDGDGTVEGLGGPKDDMVPARLSPGEFVTDAAVVSWKGEEFFHKLKKKSYEDMAENKAQNPTQTMPALPQQRGGQGGGI